MANRKFSNQLENWLSSRRSKRFYDLEDVFGEKAFGLAFLMLSIIPATPIPTAGISHVASLVSLLLSIELIIGRHSIWLPKRWRKKGIGNMLEEKALPFIMKRVKWLERLSRPRLRSLIKFPASRVLIGLIIFAFSFAAILSPPFSGLDTLPSMGIFLISLGIILEDFLFLATGFMVGCIGIGVELAAGVAISSAWQHFIN